MDVWEDSKSLAHRLKIERTLNFTTMPHEEDEYSYSQKKMARDPMSHRIIEKRRRDRMNNCLADLSRLIPATYLKKGRGRIEKTEIIEMATKHLRHLQSHTCKDPATCEVSLQQQQQQRLDVNARRVDDVRHQEEVALQRRREQHRMGFQECSSETIRFLVEVEGFYPGQGVCLRLLQHLQNHYEKLLQAGNCYMGGDQHADLNSDRPEDPTLTNGHHVPSMTPHQDDSNLLQLETNSNHSMCESYPRQATVSSRMSACGHIRSMKRPASQMSDCPSNSVELLRLNSTTRERVGSLSIRTDEEMDDDNISRLMGYGSVSVLERQTSDVSPRLLPLPATLHSRSHLRDILNQDSCPASYEQKRMRSNSVDSSRSCRTTTGVVHSHNLLPSEIYAQRSAEEVYKFKNNIKERFRADILHHHSMDTTTSTSTSTSTTAAHESSVTVPTICNTHDGYPKSVTSESFGISRMFPYSRHADEQNERSFPTLNGFGSFAVANDLAVKIPGDGTSENENENVRQEVVNAANGDRNVSSRSSSCGSNPSPNSISSNSFANQTGSSSIVNSNTSSGEGNKSGSSSGHSSTSGYSTSGEGSSTISVCNKTKGNSSCSSGGSPASSQNNADNLQSCGLLKMEDQTATSSNECNPSNLTVSLVPVFALHPKGNYYIPLTMDSSTLTPHLKGRDYLLDPEDRLPLHPVNISVCFYEGSERSKDTNENGVLASWRSKSDHPATYESYRDRLY